MVVPFGRSVPFLAPEDEGAGGSGKTVPAAGDGGKAANGAEGQGEGQPATQNYVTKESLRGAIEHVTSENKKALTAALASTQTTLADLIKSTVSEALAERLPTPDPSKKAPEKDVELSSLKRQLDESKARMAELEGTLKKKNENERQTQIKSKIVESLQKHDCKNLDRAYRAIKDDLQYDDETGTLYVTVKNEYGVDARVGLDDWIKSEVRQNIIPEMFRGVNRAGSPAEGDGGGGSRRYKYDWKKVKDDPKVMNDPEFQEALRRGEVANVGVGLAGATT